MFNWFKKFFQPAEQQHLSVSKFKQKFSLPAYCDAIYLTYFAVVDHEFHNSLLLTIELETPASVQLTNIVNLFKQSNLFELQDIQEELKLFPGQTTKTHYYCDLYMNFFYDKPTDVISAFDSAFNIKYVKHD